MDVVDDNSRVVRAWRKYLRNTKRLRGEVYDVAEEVEWSTLQRDLDKVSKREKVRN